MKFVITETQENFLWLIRRLNEPDMVDHMTDIVVEGFDYVKPCDYVTDTKGYVNDILEGSMETFINSYDDQFGGHEGIDKLHEYIYNFMRKKYLGIIMNEYTSGLEDCED